MALPKKLKYLNLFNDSIATVIGGLSMSLWAVGGIIVGVGGAICRRRPAYPQILGAGQRLLCGGHLRVYPSRPQRGLLRQPEFAPRQLLSRHDAGGGGVGRGGAVVTIKTGNPLFIKLRAAKTASGKPIPQMTIVHSDGDGHSFNIADREAYTVVSASWLNTKIRRRKGQHYCRTKRSSCRADPA